MRLTEIYNSITEKKVEDPELAAQIKEYAEISDSLDRAKAELKKLESKYKELEGVIRPLLEELQKTQDKALEVEDILVTIKRKGYERTSYAYKEALDWVKDRINPAMRKIVDDSLEATKKPAYIASQIGVQKLKEEKADSKLKMYFNKLARVFSFRNNKLSQDIDALKTKLQPV
jgi:predicted  nucleic acid-binding Zn-ribbon protein